MKAAIFGLCLFAAGAAILCSGIGSLRMGCRAKAWATTEGTLVSSQCVDYSDWDNGSSYFTHVEYRYAVAGKSYQGDRIAFGYSGGWWRRPNQKIADRLSSAKTVLVRYDPGNPAMAVLSCGVNASMVRTLFVGTWFVLVAAAVLSHAIRSRGAAVSELALSWSRNRFKIMVQGVVGGIVLLVLAGLVVGALLSFVLDYGILSTLVTG